MIKAPASESGFDRRGPGEREALILALELHADLVLIDESLARRCARENGLPVKGTLGVLEEAAGKLDLNFDSCIERLRQTNMFLDDDIVEAAIERERLRRLSVRGLGSEQGGVGRG